MLNIFKYSLAPFTVCVALFAVVSGYVWSFFIGYSFFIISSDYLLGDDTSEVTYRYPVLLDMIIYINLPLIGFLLFITCWMCSSADPFNFGKTLFGLTGHNLIAVRNGMGLLDMVALVLSTGLVMGAIGTNLGHELTHRKNNPLDMLMGYGFFAINFDCPFAIEHVHGHHKHVALEKDPATARRGERLFPFILRSTIGEYRNAWRIESRRLEKRGSHVFSLHNRYILGLVTSLLIAASCFYVGGYSALVIYLCCVLWTKVLLETVNFIEHYGLIRIEGKPIDPRHSWNTNRLISSSILFNLTRHSAHHEKANLHFWQLKPYPSAPEMPYGYLSTTYLAIFLPWVYHRMMAGLLLDWDQNFASPEERAVASRHNLKSNLSYLENIAY